MRCLRGAVLLFSMFHVLTREVRNGGHAKVLPSFGL